MTFLLVLVALVLLGAFFLAWQARETERPAAPPVELPPPPSPARIPPPLPAPPDVRPLLKPGMYMFGQLWRWDGTTWHAEQPATCEPVRALAAAKGLGVVAATWDAVLVRRENTWRRAYDTGGRPRLIGAWAHPREGLFVAGGKGTLLHAKDGENFRLEPVSEAMRTEALGAMWGDDETLFISAGNGLVVHRKHGTDAWIVENTGIRDVPMDGLMVKGRAHVAMQSGEVLQREDDGRWTLVHHTGMQLHALAYDAKRDVLYATSRTGILARQDGIWTLMPGSPQGAQSLALDGDRLLAGGSAISMLEGNTWTLGGRGLSGTIESIVVHEGTLFVGTSAFIEVT